VNVAWGNRGGSGAATNKWSPLGWNITALILRECTINRLTGTLLWPGGYPPWIAGMFSFQSHTKSFGPLATAINWPRGWKAIDIIEYSNLKTLAQTPLLISQTLTSYPKQPLATIFESVEWYLTVQGVRGWPRNVRICSPVSTNILICIFEWFNLWIQ
jgi:hypothetical protein